MSKSPDWSSESPNRHLFQSNTSRDQVEALVFGIRRVITCEKYLTHCKELEMLSGGRPSVGEVGYSVLNPQISAPSFPLFSDLTRKTAKLLCGLQGGGEVVFVSVGTNIAIETPCRKTRCIFFFAEKSLYQLKPFTNFGSVFFVEKIQSLLLRYE